MGKIRLLIPEILGSQAGVADGSSVASASTPVQNLTTSKLWQVWRSASNGPEDCLLSAYINGRQQVAIDGLAMAGLSLIPGNGEIRACCVTDPVSFPSFLPYEELVPTSIASSSGITGAVSTVDEGSGATDGSRTYENAAGGGAFVIYNFDPPASDPFLGARRQCFWLRVVAASGTSGPYTPFDTSGSAAYRRPTLTVSLYQDVAGTPTLIRVLGTKTVFGPDLHRIFFSWDATELADASGAGVQIRIDFNGYGATGFETHPDVDSVWWTCDSGQIDLLGVDGETGWSQILPVATSGIGYDYDSNQRGQKTRWSHKFDVPMTPQNVFVEIREDYVPAETTTRFNRFLLRQPLDYVQAGKLCMGFWWSPRINRAQGQFMTIVDPSPGVDDEDGGRFGRRLESYDDLRIVLDSLTEQEMAWLRDRLREFGTSGQFYFELEPDATFDLGTGGWGRIVSNTVQVSRRNTDVYKYSMEFVVRVHR